MPTDSPLMKLRRARGRIHFQLAKLEPLVAGYYAKLAEVEAAILAISPELNFPARFHKPNPHFAKGELPRVALDVLREAEGPLSVKEVAIRALVRKGVPHPHARELKQTRKRVGQIMVKWGARGLVEKVGEGKAGKRTLSSRSERQL